MTFFNLPFTILRNNNRQETKKLSEHSAGQIASRTLKPYAVKDKHQSGVVLSPPGGGFKPGRFAT